MRSFHWNYFQRGKIQGGQCPPKLFPGCALAHPAHPVPAPMGDISANYGLVSITFSAICPLTRLMSMRLKNVELCFPLLGQPPTPYSYIGDISANSGRISNKFSAINLSERWVVCLCNEPTAVQSARHDSRLKFLPITWALGKHVFACVIRYASPTYELLSW